MRNALIICALVLSNLVFAETVTQTFKDSKLNALDIEMISGNVTLTESNGTQITVTADKKKFEKNCKLEVKKDKNKLEIEVEEEGGWFVKSECEVNFQIALPKNFSVSIDNGAGNLSVQGATKNIDCDLGGGNVKISGPLKSLKCDVGGGSISANQLTGNAEVSTGAGDINLSFTKETQLIKVDTSTGAGNIDIKLHSPIAKGSLKLSTGAGDAQVALPSAAQVKADLSTGIGNVNNEFATAKKPAFDVELSSGMGNLKVYKLKK
ncbi:MAG: DUF4097 family beta strand repeat protein [Bdellovibrionaceae bacterium]|jgi:DUF4097 and DUF4098 domain-containing protein YvlB|nr:DUF4097 family beta strand repeat protein [Pseudobdellovibrionaceae bacterium]